MVRGAAGWTGGRTPRELTVAIGAAKSGQLDLRFFPNEVRHLADSGTSAPSDSPRRFTRRWRLPAPRRASSATSLTLHHRRPMQRRGGGSESTRFVPPREQFPRLAVQLVYGHLAPKYSGAYHCAGCGGMRDAADGLPRLASPEVWRRLGTIHHLTLTAESMRRLPWP